MAASCVTQSYHWWRSDCRASILAYHWWASFEIRTYAELVQLLAEYAPEPPYDAGSPNGLPAEVNAMMDAMFADFKTRAEGIAREVYARHRSG